MTLVGMALHVPKSATYSNGTVHRMRSRMASKSCGNMAWPPGVRKQRRDVRSSAGSLRTRPW